MMHLCGDDLRIGILIRASLVKRGSCRRWRFSLAIGGGDVLRRLRFGGRRL